MIQMTLSWPPSLNSYYRSVVMGKGHVGENGRFVPPMARVLISERGRDYRNDVVVKILASGLVRKYGTLTDRLKVFIVACPPDRRVRDLDDHLKALLDALTHAQVWNDDSQIDDLQIVRGGVIRGGNVAISISPISAAAQPIQSTIPLQPAEEPHPF